MRPEDVVPSKTYTATYPPKVKEKIKKELHINDDQFRYFVYVQDPRVTENAVLEDIPFNKPFCRVAIGGGETERYNFRDQQWELSGDGKYSPSLRQKFRTRLTKPK